MTLKRTFIQTVSLILWATTFSIAQALEVPAFPRFYGGVGVIVGNYRIAYNSGSYDEGIFSPSITAGYQLTPKLGVQISWAKRKNSYHLNGSAYLPLQFPAASGTYGNYSNVDNHSVISVPLLFRYTGTNKLHHRVQFDVLGGLTLLRASRGGRTLIIDSLNSVVLDVVEAQKTTQAALTLGLAVRARLFRQLELVGDMQGNRTLVNRGYGKNRFVPTYTVGLRYGFHKQ